MELPCGLIIVFRNDFAYLAVLFIFQLTLCKLTLISRISQIILMSVFSEINLEQICNRYHSYIYLPRLLNRVN